MQYFDEVIAELKKITLKNKDEIIDFVSSNVISYDDYKQFYLAFARDPALDECKTIYHLGVGNYLELKRKELI